MSEESGGTLPARANPEGQLELWGEVLAVERERIASRDRAVEAMREGFAKLDAADDRQFKFHTDRLHRDDEFRNRRLTHVIPLAWVGVPLQSECWGSSCPCCSREVRSSETRHFF